MLALELGCFSKEAAIARCYSARWETGNYGGNKQSGKVGGTEGSCKNDGSDEEENDYELTNKKEQTMMEMMKNQGKKTEKMVMELMKVVMEIMALVIIVKNPVPMKIMMAVKNNQGKMVELRGLIRRMIVMKK